MNRKNDEERKRNNGQRERQLHKEGILKKKGGHRQTWSQSDKQRERESERGRKEGNNAIA